MFTNLYTTSVALMRHEAGEILGGRCIGYSIKTFRRPAVTILMGLMDPVLILLRVMLPDKPLANRQHCPVEYQLLPGIALMGNCQLNRWKELTITVWQPKGCSFKSRRRQQNARQR